MLTDIDLGEQGEHLNDYTLSHLEKDCDVTARIPDEDPCYHARNLCVFSHAQKGTPGLTHTGYVLQCVSLGVSVMSRSFLG